MSSLLVAALVFALKVYPLVSFAPSELHLTITADPVESARSLRVEIDGDVDYFRSTTLPIDSEKAPRTHYIVWRAVPGGEYVVTAWLLGTSDVIIRKATQQVTVGGR